jgi:hypothetical protein
MVVEMLLLQLLLVVRFGPSAVFAHPDGPAGFRGCVFDDKRN